MDPLDRSNLSPGTPSHEVYIPPELLRRLEREVHLGLTMSDAVISHLRRSLSQTWPDLGPEDSGSGSEFETDLHSAYNEFLMRDRGYSEDCPRELAEGLAKLRRLSVADPEVLFEPLAVHLALEFAVREGESATFEDLARRVLKLLSGTTVVPPFGYFTEVLKTIVRIQCNRAAGGTE